MRVKARKYVINAENLRRKQEGRVIVSSESLAKFAISRAFVTNKAAARTLLENAKTQLESRMTDFSDSERVVSTIKRLKEKIDAEIERLG